MSRSDRDQEIAVKRELDHRPAVGTAIQLVPGLCVGSTLRQPVIAIRQCVEPVSSFSVLVPRANALYGFAFAQDRRLIPSPPPLVQQPHSSSVLIDRERTHDLQSARWAARTYSSEFAAVSAVGKGKARTIDGNVDSRRFAAG